MGLNKYLNVIQEQEEKAIIGKHNDIPDSEFDPKELAMGIKIEYEHTDIREVALSIAKDHLSEIPNYYTKLLKMEKDAKKELGIK